MVRTSLQRHSSIRTYQGQFRGVNEQIVLTYLCIPTNVCHARNLEKPNMRVNNKSHFYRNKILILKRHVCLSGEPLCHCRILRTLLS